eukprot:gene1645-12719_t
MPQCTSAHPSHQHIVVRVNRATVHPNLISRLGDEPMQPCHGLDQTVIMVV